MSCNYTVCLWCKQLLFIYLIYSLFFTIYLFDFCSSRMPDCCNSENFFYGWCKAVFSGPDPSFVQSDLGWL